MTEPARRLPSTDDERARARPHGPHAADEHTAESTVDQPTAAEQSAAPEPAVEVVVARTGGFAGITRRWSAQPPDDEASEWITLLDRCPWDGVADNQAPATDGTDRAGAPSRAMADRFVWWIRASWTGVDPREAELPDDQLTGAWRELVDAVRERGHAVPPRER